MAGLSRTSFFEARMRLAACLCVIMLSIDFINPVKILSGALQMPSIGSYVAFIALGFAVNLVYANAKDFAYYSTKTFFSSVLNIFFSNGQAQQHRPKRTSPQALATQNKMPLRSARRQTEKKTA